MLLDDCSYIFLTAQIRSSQSLIDQTILISICGVPKAGVEGTAIFRMSYDWQVLHCPGLFILPSTRVFMSV